MKPATRKLMGSFKPHKELQSPVVRKMVANNYKRLRNKYGSAATRKAQFSVRAQ